MKIGYFGSPEISAELLNDLIKDPEHEVLFVLSNADRRRGRSKKLLPTAVSQIAIDHNLPLFRYESLKDDQVLEEISAFDADLYVVFAYGKLIPENIFSLPKNGSINLHASILPKLRGASPIQSCLLDGYSYTGWTVQFIGEKMDAGDILCQNELEIQGEETAGDLSDRLLPSGIDLIKYCLSDFLNLSQTAKKQNEDDSTHCSKLRPDDSFIDWSLGVKTIHNKIRGMNPSPGARSLLNNELLKIWRSSVVDGVPTNWQGVPTGSFGAGLNKGDLWVRCGDGVLSLTELQPVGRKKLTARDFLNGYRTKGFVILGGNPH